MRQRHHRLHQLWGLNVCFTTGHGVTLPVTWTEEVRGRGERWRGRPSVSHQHPSVVSPPPSSVHFCHILSLYFNVATSGSLCGAEHQPLLLFPPLLLSLFLALPLSRPQASAHTRTDPTISPIQPPKSNYHGQNRVIKSNGLLDEVHAALQSGTSPLALRSTLFNVLLTSWLAPTLVADANSQSSLSKLFFSTHHQDFVLWYHRKKRHPYSFAIVNSD